MNRTLTSWKEIAQHFGKGVRTVQRWEQNIGLPVRRPRERARGIVLAMTDELDVWLNSTFAAQGPEAELQLLMNQIATLKKENELLRAKLEQTKKATAVNSVVSTDGFDPMHQLILKRCAHAIERSIQLRLNSAEVLDMARNLKALRQMQKDGRSEWAGNSYLH